MPHHSARSARYSRIHHVKHSESSLADSTSSNQSVNVNYFHSSGAINVPFTSQFGWRYDREDLSERWWEKPIYIHTYIILIVDLIFGIFYLSYIGIMMNERTLNWDYTIILEFQERNTWSLIGPWLLIILSLLVFFKLYTKGRIQDGDFQGILGIAILIAIIVFMEGYALYETSENISKGNRNESLYEDLQLYMINASIEAKDMGAIYYLPNWLQEDYQCCGVKNHNDWMEMDEDPPDSCGCKKEDGPNCHQPDGFGTKYIWKRGCADLLWDRLGPIYLFIAGLHFTCSALLIYNSLVFVCLFKPMKMWEKRKKGPSTERIIGQPRDLLKLRRSEIPGRRPSSHERKKINLQEKARQASLDRSARVLKKDRVKSSLKASKGSGMKAGGRNVRTEDILIDIGPKKESFIHYFPPTNEDDEDLLRLVSKQGKQHHAHHMPHPHMPHLHKRKRSTDSQRSNKSNKSNKSLDSAYKNLGNYKKDEKAWSYTSLNKNVGKNQRNFFETMDENGDPIKDSKSKDKDKLRKSSLDKDADKIDRIEEPKKKKLKKDSVTPIPAPIPPTKEHKKEHHKKQPAMGETESKLEKDKNIKKHPEKVESPKRTSGESRKSLGDDKSHRKGVATSSSPKRRHSEGGKSLGKGAKDKDKNDDGIAIHKEKAQIGNKSIALHKEPGKIGHKHPHHHEKDKDKGGSPRGKSQMGSDEGPKKVKTPSQSPRRKSPVPRPRSGSASSGKSLSPSEKSEPVSILKTPSKSKSKNKKKLTPSAKNVHFS